MALPKTEADYLALWRTLAPPEYTAPLEDEAGGQGLDPIAAYAVMFSEAEQRAAELTQAYYLAAHSLQQGPPASESGVAVAQVQLTRTAPADFDLLVQAGSVYEAVQLGTNGQELLIGEFTQDADLLIASGTLGATVANLTAELPGYWGNVPAGSIARLKRLGKASVTAVLDSPTLVRRVVTPNAATDRFLPVHAGRYVRVLSLPVLQTPRRIVAVLADTIQVDPPLPLAYVGSSVHVEVLEWADLGVDVTQSAAAVGGVSGQLDAIAEDRNEGRARNEPDATLRDRLRYLDDTISPAAIRRAITSVLGPTGWLLLETRDVQTLKGFVWGREAWGVGQLAPIVRVPGSQLVGNGAVWLCGNALKRCFVILVRPSGDGEFGFAYGPIPGASNAWGLHPWGGFPAGFYARVAALWRKLDGARGAGVQFRIYRDASI